MEFDRTLIERKVVAELKKIAGTDHDDDEEHDPGQFVSSLEEGSFMDQCATSVHFPRVFKLCYDAGQSPFSEE